MPNLLLIDDSPEIHALLRAEFDAGEFVIYSAYSAAQGIERFQEVEPDVVLLDVGLPDDSGLNVFRTVHGIDARVPVIFLTGGSTTETAIEAMSLGAHEYLLKPFDTPSLRKLLASACVVSRLARSAPKAVEEANHAGDEELILGRCPAMHEVYKSIGRVSKLNVTVLITGESGTGKELVARSIYHYSTRAKAPFLAINCAAIPETLLESELFGHEQGAFTGASHRRIGKFEQCNGGTLFLDEIGEMTPTTQAKLLRVLQDQYFERVGGNQSIRTDVRILAATNRDLPDFVKKGLFREDLYYRFNVYSIPLPPLRERAGDLALLANWLLRRYAREIGKPVAGIAPSALQILHQHSWPGNVRELQSVLKYALVQATSPVIVPEFLPPIVFHRSKSIPAKEDSTSVFGEWDSLIQSLLDSAPANLYEEWLARTDSILLTHVLRLTSGNLVHAAKILGIHRSTIRAKIRSLNISLASFRANAAETAPDGDLDDTDH